MTNSLSNLPETSFEPVVSAIAALLFAGILLSVLARAYWVWHRKNYLHEHGRDSIVFGRTPTLFDVRELLVKGKRDEAIKVYRQIFKVDQKEAQKAVKELQQR